MKTILIWGLFPFGGRYLETWKTRLSPMQSKGLFVLYFFGGGRRGEGRREEEDEEERGEISKILESRFKLALTFVVFTFSMRFSWNFSFFRISSKWSGRGNYWKTYLRQFIFFFLLLPCNTTLISLLVR